MDLLSSFGVCKLDPDFENPQMLSCQHYGPCLYFLDVWPLCVFEEDSKQEQHLSNRIFTYLVCRGVSGILVGLLWPGDPIKPRTERVPTFEKHGRMTWE